MLHIFFGYYKRSSKVANWFMFSCGIIGPVFVVVGLLISNTQNDFLKNSIRTTLLVTRVDSEVSSSGFSSDKSYTETVMYRPVFELVYHENKGKTYGGDNWLNPSPHKKGDIVFGWYNKVTGEMVSQEMMQVESWLSWIFVGLGMIVIVGSGWVFVRFAAPNS